MSLFPLRVATEPVRLVRKRGHKPYKVDGWQLTQTFQKPFGKTAACTNNEKTKGKYKLWKRHLCRTFFDLICLDRRNNTFGMIFNFFFFFKHSRKRVDDFLS